jgi:hypothetical protein
VIDRLIASMYEMRMTSTTKTKASDKELKNARSGREGWWRDVGQLTGLQRIPLERGNANCKGYYGSYGRFATPKGRKEE